jgi:hypothetical protein
MIQCHLTKGDTNDIAWIEAKLAVQGKVVKIKQEDGTWDEGWIVSEAFPNVVLDSKVVNERSQDYKKTRVASDI